MNKISRIKPAGSLLERASEMYDFGAALRSPKVDDTKVDGPKADAPKSDAPTEDVAAKKAVEAAEAVEAQPVANKVEPTKAEQAPAPTIEAPAPSIKRASDLGSDDVAADTDVEEVKEEAKVSPVPDAVPAEKPALKIPTKGGIAKVDRQWLIENNFVDPDGAVSGLSEEFRIVKRQLLLAARGGKGYDAVKQGERILVCSAHPDEGKTYTAVNLALSIAKEKDNRVLLVDADFAKPSVMETLGLENSAGLMDALGDPSCDAESLVLETDVPGLSVLPAGTSTNHDTEFLASSRTGDILDDLSRNDPARIIIFDSPPALAASPASVLALHVGQCLMVVKADETTDSALRDALNLLSGCEHIQLLLNRAKFSPTGRNFGSYYGYGA